jgi:tight adherence protein C
MSFNEFAKMVTDPMLLAACMLGMAVCATILTVAAPWFSNDQLESRLKAVADKREELRKRNRAALEAKGKGALRQTSKGFMNDTVQQLNLQKLLEDDTLDSKLTQAGLRGPGPVSTFYFFRFAAPIGLGLLMTIYVFLPTVQKPQMEELTYVMVAIAVGYYAPNIYLSNKIQKRRESIVSAFPDALDMLLICVEAGMSIEVALQRVSSEVGPMSIELAEELSLTHAELSYLQDRRVAYENLARRTNHPGVKGVAMALVQAERYGTPLGQALRVMARENRELRITEAEKKAAALPAKLTVPMIVFFLPVLFLVILGPAAMKVADLGAFG